MRIRIIDNEKLQKFRKQLIEDEVLPAEKINTEILLNGILAEIEVNYAIVDIVVIPAGYLVKLLPHSQDAEIIETPETETQAIEAETEKTKTRRGKKA